MSSNSDGTDFPLTIAAWSVAAATMLSGPIGFLVTLARAQPPWTDASTYALHVHPLQQAPFWAGFVLIAACVLLIARMASLGFEHHRTRSLIALVTVGIYASMIAINYALQVALVPTLAHNADPALGYLTMTNPNAATWVLEMFGYGILGIATAVVAPIVAGASSRRRWIRGLLRVNGIVSVLAAVVTAVRLSWVQSPAGLVSFLAWNTLLTAAMVLIGIEYAPRRGNETSSVAV